MGVDATEYRRTHNGCIELTSRDIVITNDNVLRMCQHNVQFPNGDIFILSVPTLMAPTPCRSGPDDPVICYGPTIITNENRAELERCGTIHPDTEDPAFVVATHISV